jgi:hypothetical protein
VVFRVAFADQTEIANAMSERMSKKRKKAKEIIRVSII